MSINSCRSPKGSTLWYMHYCYKHPLNLAASFDWSTLTRGDVFPAGTTGYGRRWHESGVPGGATDITTTIDTTITSCCSITQQPIVKIQLWRCQKLPPEADWFSLFLSLRIKNPATSVRTGISRFKSCAPRWNRSATSGAAKAFRTTPHGLTRPDENAAQVCADQL